MNGQLSGDPVADIHKQQGISKFKEKNYGRAFAHFSFALSLKPTWRDDLQKVYFASLYAWCEKLESEGKHNDLYLCYEQALALYPDNVDALCSLADQLNRSGLKKEATEIYKKCIQLDQNHISSYHNLQNLFNQLVERWHFRMLNDTVRNNAYKEAIAKKISQGHRKVLDIGTGTGLLSLFAVESGATEVYACDHSSVMIEIASEVFKPIKSTQRIKLIEKTSTELMIPHDLPNRVSLVITETMDAGVFGENLLQTLIHAWKKLLLPSSTAKSESVLSPQGCCIPHQVDVYVLLVQSDYLSKKFRSFKNDSQILPVNLPDVVVSLDEPYDTEDLRRLNPNLSYLSEPKKIISTNFNNLEELLELYETKIRKQVNVEVTLSGRLDAIVCFFRLKLDENIVLSSSPFETENVAKCWDQAVFPVLQPIHLTMNEEISLSFNCFEGRLAVCLADEIINEQRSGKENELRLTQDNVRLLNDSRFMEALNEAILTLSATFSKSNPSQVSVLDLSSLPILGLTLAQELLRNNESILFDLIYLAEDNSVESFVESFIQQNSILITKSCSVKSFNQEDLSTFLEHENAHDFVIMNNFVSSDGSLNEKMFRLLPAVRKTLKSNGKILPEKITCFGQLVSSDWLSRVSSVTSNCENDLYGIPSVINQFQVSHQYCLNLETLQCTDLSDEFKVFSICTKDYTEEKEQTDIKVKVTSSGMMNSTVIWFSLSFLEATPCSTVLLKYSNSCTSQLATLMNPPVSLDKGTFVTVSSAFEKGLFQLKIS